MLRDWFGHTGTEHYSDYFADTKLREFQAWHSQVSSVGGRPLPHALLGRPWSTSRTRTTRRSSRHEVKGSDIDALWQDLGRAAGSVDVGL